MCSPTALMVSSFALGAFQSVGSYLQSQDQYTHLKHQNAMNRVLAKQAYDQDMQSLELRSAQEVDLSLQKREQAQKKSLTQQSRILATSTGVEGLSLDALVGDIIREEGAYNLSVDRNLSNQLHQLSYEANGLTSRYKSRLSKFSSPVRPSFLNTALSIGSQGLNSYLSFKED